MCQLGKLHILFPFHPKIDYIKRVEGTEAISERNTDPMPSTSKFKRIFMTSSLIDNSTPVDLLPRSYFVYDTPSQLRDKVKEWTVNLCQSLEKNYENYHRRMITSNSERYSGELSEYAQNQLDALNNGTANLMRFVIKEGKKYLKVIQQDYDTFQDRNCYRDGSVHAFIDKNTGEVYKPASWKSPAKHVRYDMRIMRDRKNLSDPNFTTWAGGYLYMR